VPWTRNPRLVRGLDYYRHTAFEFVTDRLGAQGTVIAGGRYDGLIETLGGPHTPAVGWAAGIERLAMMIDAPPAEALDVIIVVDDDRAQTAGAKVLSHLRFRGLASDIIATGSPRKRFDRAVKRGANEILILSVGDQRITSRLKTSGVGAAEAELTGFNWPPPDPA
jgi:histidyl-tRNA synthetase